VDQKLPKILVCSLFPILIVGLAACGPKSPEERVAALRAQYTVELNAWMIQKSPEPEPILDEEATAPDETAEPVDDEAGAMNAAPAGPQNQDVLFDLVVLFKGDEPLDGLTVDVTQAGADRVDKAVYRQWIDTKGLIKGDTGQRNFVLSVPVAEGDAFSVALAAGIPADLGQYPEFAHTP